MLSDQPGIGRGTRVQVRPVALGPKLSRRSWARAGGRLAAAPGPPAARPRARSALRRAAPALQEGAAAGARAPAAAAAAARVGRVGPGAGPAAAAGCPRGSTGAPGAGADAVLAISPDTRDSRARGGRSTRRASTSCHNVVSAEEMRLPARTRAAALRAELGDAADGAFVVGCVSRFHPEEAQRRRDRRRAAASPPTPEAPPVHLVMAGDGETEAELRARAAPLGPAAHFLPTPGDRGCRAALGVRRRRCSARRRPRARRAP